ncbi:DUF748 domain-containing protein [Maridesulfovibrio zosterae]|uniref:DUF748 domain-containing protein n=1 Tax=Maridesulfovibrio zosterae TaxID=82171 RepID=UPI00042952FB|nr:DUF748 domain-containing protein [Maridesulfovibrio zosterae]
MFKNIHSKWNLLNKWSKISVVIGILLVFYTLIGFFLIPFTARKIALSKLPELLNRPVSINSLDFNPYTLHIEIDGFKIGKREGDGNLFSFKSFDLNFDSFSLFRLSAIFDQIKIVDPQVDISIFRGGSSISDLIPIDSANDEPVVQEKESKKIFPFILHNLVITNGTCKVYDKVRDLHHVISDLNLSVPFTSSLLRDNEKQVQPSLNMVINGTPFVLNGHSLPFKSSLKTEFLFSLKDAPIGEYWPYLPIYETTSLKSGFLNTNLSLAFERSEILLPHVVISGNANIKDFDLTAKDGPSLLKFKELDVNLDEIGILRRIIKIGSIKLTDPYLKVGLKKDGSPDLLDYLSPSIEAGEKSKENEQDTGPALAALVREFKLENGQVDFTDNAFSHGFHKLIGPITVNVGNISTDENSMGNYAFSIGSNATETISSNGHIGIMPLSVNGSMAVTDLDIPDYHIYLDDPLPLDIASGKITVGSDFVFAAKTDTVRLNNIHVDVNNIELQPKGGGKSLIDLDGFAMTNGTVDVKDKSIFIDSINLNKALIKLMRNSKGIDILQQIEKHQKKMASKQSKDEVEIKEEKVEESVKEAASELQEKQWQVVLNRFKLTDSAVELTDKAATKTTKTVVSDIKIGVNGLTYPEQKQMELSLGAKINGRGFLDIKGQAGAQSLSGAGSISLRKFRLRDFNGYLPPEMQLNIARGHIDVNGNWNFSAANDPVASYTGKVQLKDLLVRDSKGNSKFLHLNEFSAQGINLVSAPFMVKVESVGVVEPEVHLAREADGTFNIARMLTGKKAVPVNATLVQQQAEKAASKAKIDTSASKKTVAAEAEGSKPVDKSANNIYVSKMFMSNGTVLFKDHTVSPAFELDITKMYSAVRGLELPRGDRTDLSFNATFDGQAPLVVEGFLQPTDDGANTDLTLSLANLDMTQLSPYTKKFIAYPVSTGMLSSDVAVKLRSKYLAVENVFDIYQFEVGDKVDNPDAPNIPIGLGLALLRDSSGNIRLDIPVEGDLSDPQFKLGRVIGMAIVNLLVKAVTSPFALIGSLVGGGEDMDVLIFDSGVAGPKESELSKIESVAKAMKDRPGLKLQISGFTSPDDIPTMEKAEFNRQIAMPKFLELEGDENAPASVKDVVLSSEEYPEYLEIAYKEAPFDKPKNFLGFVETLPIPDMEKALRDHIKITDTQLSELARMREESVRKLLTGKFGVEPERVFLKRLSATGKGSGPRVELGLQ